jgi:hypothetical protein
MASKAPGVVAMIANANGWGDYHREMSRRGGLSRSERKVAAAKANLAKAKAARLATKAKPKS